MNAQIRINKDTDAVEIFTGDKWVATYTQEDIDKLTTDLDIALSYIKQYELEIARLKQEVAFLEDWRAVWAPVVRQHQGLE
jgi:hypothetical protein